jgi:hypothetical protein
MRKLLVFSTAIILALGLAGSAAAKELKYQGTMFTKLGAAQDKLNHITASGLATVNLSSGGGLLNTLRIGGTSTGSNFNPVTDPETSGTIKTLGVTGTRMSATFKDFQSPPLTSNTMVVGGFNRICLFVPCAELSPQIIIPLSVNNGKTAVGVGGLLTGNFGLGTIRISLEAAPWTLGSGSAVNQTDGGNFKTVAMSGFIHGAASAGTGSTAVTSGVVQLISPMQVTTVGISGNNQLLSLFVVFKIHFIPEPGVLLLLGAGVVGLSILGRNRMRR